MQRAAHTTKAGPGRNGVLIRRRAYYLPDTAPADERLLMAAEQADRLLHPDSATESAPCTSIDAIQIIVYLGLGLAVLLAGLPDLLEWVAK